MKNRVGAARGRAAWPWALLVTLACAAPSSAQEVSGPSRWSIGTSLTYPLVRIYVVHVGYRIDDRHEVVVGPGFQNFRHDSFTSNAYTLLVGYRHYLRENLSIEAELYPAYNRLYSNVTESHYPGVELWAELKVGYKIDFANDRFYLQPAPGVGFGLLRTNKPPRFQEEIVSPIFVPQMVLGMRF